MKTVKTSVFALGIVLSSVPFWGAAIAQSSNDSTSLLLNMQDMRIEIAELRDMVERQQFELKKLKQRLAAEDNANLSVPSTSATEFAPSAQNTIESLGEATTAAETLDSQNSDSQTLTTQPTPSQSGVIINSSIDSVIDNSVGTNKTTTTIPGAPIIAIPNQAGSVAPSDTSVVNSNTNIIDAGQNPVPPKLDGMSASDLNPPTSDALQTEQQSTSVLAAQATKKSQPEPTVPQFTEDQYYDRGFGFLKQTQYDQAITVFKEQIATYPQGELADDAHYWIAEALFINRKQAQAKPYLRAIIDNYPQSARMPDAMLKTAYIEQDMGNVIEARILLQEIIAKFTSSNAAIAARNRLDNIKNNN